MRISVRCDLMSTRAIFDYVADLILDYGEPTLVEVRMCGASASTFLRIRGRIEGGGVTDFFVRNVIFESFKYDFRGIKEIIFFYTLRRVPAFQ